ncbi:hypothetical protein chiPu_0030191, partial [Chiloscyllium punctatum]|nr:hypothetical protein [Chiloscyllium punctatum]
MGRDVIGGGEEGVVVVVVVVSLADSTRHDGSYLSTARTHSRRHRTDRLPGAG